MVVGFGASMVASLSAQVIASRSLGPEIYGLYGLVVSNVALISGIFDSGPAGAMTAFAAEKDAQKDGRGVSSIIKTGVGIEIVLSTLFASIVCAFNRGIADQLFLGMPSLVLFFTIIVIMQAFYGIFSGIIQGLRELRLVAALRLIQQFSLLLLMLCLVRGLSWGLEAALSLHSFSLFLAALTGVLLTQRIVRSKYSMRSSSGSRESIWANAASILQFSLPVSMVAISSNWIQSSGPAVMNYFTDHDPGDQLGILVVTLTLARSFDRILKTVIKSAFPYLVNWNTKGDLAKTRKYVTLMVLAVAGGYVFVILGSLLIGDQAILLVYGKGYSDVIRYLPIALLAFCAVSLSDIYRVSLFSLKSPELFLLVSFGGLLVFISILVAGRLLLDARDPIFLIFCSMGSAYLAIVLGAAILFRMLLKRRRESDFVSLRF